MRSRMSTLWLLVLVTAATACERSSTREETVVHAPDVITVRSSAFREGHPIPARFTCDGDGQSPPLSWEGVPADAAAVALVVDDPDAPHRTFVHWVVLDMPAGTSAVHPDEVPAGAVQARNSAGDASYFGPCPPSGTHHYRFTVYALAKRTGLRAGAGLDQALRAVEKTATAQGRLVGTYARHG